ncbi:glycosyl hydrolase family 95 catalytic domain-containing protein [Brachybacterium sp. J153]|uniref:glycosyl hydrolase family 95 catalytic domain-containing protein n=1 Tax=Brachybacterium sp. J153 TaxID=3116488 RepID=UPI002E7993F0|nr:glycoside hydrolase N-terminal domain-containing protein [Brachybacterium sp. J153]MEE1618724.1 glycoside hydrolase N-terminal domain-containing protein [Brachybacterium sp. J153]
MTVLARESPAADWLDALPLGNGRLGAMAWGDPTRARFGLNESTLWSGMPGVDAAHRTDAETARAARQEALTLFRAGRESEAERALGVLGASWSQAFQPVGDLVVEVPGALPGPRELDLVAALHRVRTPPGEHVSYVSAADEVLVHAVPLAAGASLRVSLDSPQVEEHREELPDGLDLVLRVPSDSPPGHAPGRPPVRWDEDAPRVAVAVRWQHGSGADGEGRAVLVAAVVTSWTSFGRRPDRPAAEILAEAREQAEGALARGEAELLARHAAAPLPGAHEMGIELPREGRTGLLGDVLAYGRYLLAASSRPGLPPANLQGLWNELPRPPWSSNFTTNINVEMNHWPAATAHVPDAAAALEAWVGLLRETGRETARRLYDSGGWVLHHNSDAWGYTDPVDGDASWAIWPMGGLWLELQLEDLSRFTGEEPVARAARRLPALRETAAFALDLLREDQAGEHLVTFPSTSPENRWRTTDGQVLALTEGSGMDRWLVRGVLSALLEAAELTGAAEDPLLERARAALPRVQGPRVGADGRLLEWHDALDEAEPAHRHVSHLATIFPGTERLSPEIEAAAIASLEARGDEATGWSLAWKTALWARLHRPEKVQDLLELFLRDARTEDGERSGLYPNLFSAHPPFQMDANFGIVAAVAECLVQSHRGEIELLPALAPLLATGSVRGLRARPGVVVDLAWEDGRPTSVRLAALGPGAAGEHTVRLGAAQVVVDLPADGTAVELGEDELRALAGAH